jgi:hypothetical protein
MPSDQPTIDDVRKRCGEPQAYIFEFPPSGYFGVYVKIGSGRPARLGFGSSSREACQDAIAKHDAAVASLDPTVEDARDHALHEATRQARLVIEFHLKRALTDAEVDRLTDVLITYLNEVSDG